MQGDLLTYMLNELQNNSENLCLNDISAILNLLPTMNQRSVEYPLQSNNDKEDKYQDQR